MDANESEKKRSKQYRLVNDAKNESFEQSFEKSLTQNSFKQVKEELFIDEDRQVGNISKDVVTPNKNYTH